MVAVQIFRLCHETKLQQLQTRGKPNHNARYPQTVRFMIGLPHFLAFISGGVTWATDGCIRHSNTNPYHPYHPNHQISSKFTSSKPWSFRGILTFEFFRVSCSPACDSPASAPCLALELKQPLRNLNDLFYVPWHRAQGKSVGDRNGERNSWG